VKVLDGELASPTSDEVSALKRSPSGVRLACRAAIAGAVTVRPVVVNSTQSASQPELAGDAPLVVGVDLGTTTLAAAAVDERSGRQLGSSLVLNRQQAYGADVLTRVSAALDGDAGELRRLAEESVLDAIDSAAPGARTRIRRVVVAANVAMASLLVGADVRTLAAHPFSPPAGSDSMPSDSMLAAAMPDAALELVPPMAGFVGGDALAGLLALQPTTARRPRLLVDIGTNAEVVLESGTAIWVASAAAGPAFEGGGITCGGPAVPEAVVSVAIEADGSVVLTTAGRAEATWFSGSGLVSAVSELRRAGHIDPQGRLSADGPLRQRFSTDAEGVLGVALGATGGCLVLTQRDVRALQLAKAAVRVAIQTVLAQAGVSAAQLGALHVAGAFGAALATADLVELGVVPSATADVVVYAGNAALLGATAMAVDPALQQVARERSRAAQLVDLAADPEFGARLLAAVELAPF
jgi:uncharacterized 2Fe-2S/4Fe-4S cluster protein (DUF4445 family)